MGAEASCCAARPKKKGEQDGGSNKLSLKVVVVGDGAVGKTCLLVVFRDDKFPEEYVPTVFDNYAAHVRCMIDGKSTYVSYDLWDTAGQECYDVMRQMSYADTDVFLVVFSKDNRASFENAKNTWHPDLLNFEDSAQQPGPVRSGRAKLVLVGTKSDLPNPVVTDAEAQEMARQLGMYAYVSCSAKTKENVPAVFDMVVKASKGLHRDTRISTSKQALDTAAPGAAQQAPTTVQPYQQTAAASYGQAAAHPGAFSVAGSQPQMNEAPPTAQPYQQTAAASYGQAAAHPGSFSVAGSQMNEAPLTAQPYQQAAAASYGQAAAHPGASFISVAGLHPGLPKGWEKKFDAAGKPYYVDHSTKSTQWQPPSGYTG